MRENVKFNTINKYINNPDLHKLPEPTIEERDGGVMISIQKFKYKEKEGGSIGLSDTQKLLIQIIDQNPKITIKDIAHNLNINTSAVDKHIVTLKKKGVLQRIGGTRGYWKIIETKVK